MQTSLLEANRKVELDHQTMIQKISSSSHLQTHISPTNQENEEMNPEASEIDPSLLDYSVRHIPISLRSKNEEEEEEEKQSNKG